MKHTCNVGYPMTDRSEIRSWYDLSIGVQTKVTQTADIAAVDEVRMMPSLRNVVSPLSISMSPTGVFYYGGQGSFSLSC